MNSRYPNQFTLMPLPRDVFYFPSYRTRNPMAGPTCYYHAYRHLLDIYGIHTVPTYIETMMVRIDHANDGADTVAIIYQTITDYADELLWIVDEVDQLNHADSNSDASNELVLLNDESSNDDSDDWAQDFIDHLGIENSIARLLHLQLSTLEIDQITIQQLTLILNQNGPIAIGMRNSTELPLDYARFTSVVVCSKQTGETRDAYQVDDYLKNGVSHYVLLIGIENSQRNVYFIDPNYPTIVLTLSFDVFKTNLSTGDYAHMPKNVLSASPVKFIEVTEENSSNLAAFKRKKH